MLKLIFVVAAAATLTVLVLGFSARQALAVPEYCAQRYNMCHSKCGADRKCVRGCQSQLRHCAYRTP